VANRVREDTLVSYRLETYLEGLKLPNGKRLPFLTVLRASQNYIRAADQGLTIFELAPSMTYYDMEQWVPLLRWLNSPRSIPG
ncbi:MAG: chromosome partitioning protein, partial [Gammaproteobacteria bacterium]